MIVTASTNVNVSSALAGSLDVSAVYQQSFFHTVIPVQAKVVIGETEYQTPFSTDLQPGTYTLIAEYLTFKQESTVTIVEGETETVELMFKPFPWELILIGLGVAGALGVTAYALTRKKKRK